VVQTQAFFLRLTFRTTFCCPLPVADPLCLEPRVMRLPLLFLSGVFRVTFLMLLALTSLLVFNLMLLVFGGKSGLQKLVTQVLHRPSLP
jgi:hypothetical protein